MMNSGDMGGTSLVSLLAAIGSPAHEATGRTLDFYRPAKRATPPVTERECAPRGFAQELEDAAADLALHLADVIAPDGFPDRTYYGEAFALWLWTHFDGQIPTDAIEGAVAGVLGRDPDASHAHHEFNNLALLKYHEATADPRVLGPIQEMRVRRNHMPNWAFLRIYGKLLHNRTFDRERFSERKLHRELRALLRMLMRPYGLICDTRYLCDQLPVPCFDRTTADLAARLIAGAKSLCDAAPVGGLGAADFDRARAGVQALFSRSTAFMYHCFDLSSLYGILELTGWDCAEDAFFRGAEFISDFVLRNGDTIYVGRGQQQLFAYGALIFSLCAAAARWREGRFLHAAERAFRFVMRHQRLDGTLPLVVRHGEQGWPHVEARAASPDHPGWYRYNNSFDYPPAFAVFALRAAQVLREVPGRLDTPTPARRGLTLYGREMAIWRDDLLEAVVSAPGGYWANALPVPYLCVDGTSVTPCYGGDRMPPTLYSAEMIPLPQVVDRRGRRICFADSLQYTLLDDDGTLVLEGRGRGIRHRRRFEFGRRRIIMRDELTFTARAAASLREVAPVVVWGLQMEPLADGRWSMHDDPRVTLRLDHTEGTLEPVEGFCARGAIAGLRETLQPDPSRRSFSRRMEIEIGRDA